MLTVRQKIAKRWLAQHLGVNDFRLISVSGDASFRQYFRVHLSDGKTYILADADPDKNDNEKLINVSKILKKINIPKIHASNLGLGFILLEDFGDDTLQKVLTPKTTITLYKKAVDELIHLQAITVPDVLLYPLNPLGI